jgi:hypothetical protein
MSETSPSAGPIPDLYDLIWFPSASWCEELAAVALPERWDDDASGRPTILFNYFKYYLRRVLEEEVWVEATSPEGTRVAAFDTGLLSRHFEPIYAVFEANRNEDRQPWVHKEWAAPSSPRLLANFDVSAIRRALFFSDPAEVVYDPRLPVVPNLNHVVDDNVDRYPPELQESTYRREAALDRAIKVAGARARANWRLAAPQFYWPPSDGPGRVQLLLPLCLVDPDRVDLALVIDRSPSYVAQPDAAKAYYRAYTVLPLEWAYRNARLITRPEASWLDINVTGSADPEPRSAKPATRIADRPDEDSDD